jgi:hypothetical protein
MAPTIWSGGRNDGNEVVRHWIGLDGLGAREERVLGLEGMGGDDAGQTSAVNVGEDVAAIVLRVKLLA